MTMFTMFDVGLLLATLTIVDIKILYFISVILIAYGITGFFVNILDLNSIKNKIQKDIKWMMNFIMVQLS